MGGETTNKLVLSGYLLDRLHKAVAYIMLLLQMDFLG